MAQTRRRGGRSNGSGHGRGNGNRFRVPIETKVWHDPLLKPRNGNGTAADAVEAAPVPAPAPTPPEAPRRAARIIAGPKPPTDPRELERQRLLARLLAAEGRPSITRAVDDYLAGGFELPRTQEVWLQVLEHRDEGKVQGAIATLQALLEEAPAHRRAVLDARLRSIEELADEGATRRAAADLRRFLLKSDLSRGDDPSALASRQPD
jgi:hypothetical protein